MRKLHNYINGQWTQAESPDCVESHNPANREEVIYGTHGSTVAETTRAIEAAAAAFPEWARTPMPRRTALLHNFLAHLRGRAEELASAITRENGKTLRESRVEFVAAIDEAEFQLGQGRRTGGTFRPSNLPGVSCHLRREPLGVVSLITPWNFPLNVACRKMIPALIAGNTCVLKPAELTPMSAVLLFESLHTAGLPPGVANLVLGRGSVIGATLVGHPHVRGLSFTGSTEVGLGIARQLAGRATKLQLELGGKNPLVVLADADLEKALEAAVTGAFSCSGQWCTSTSRVIVESPVYDEFLARLAERVRSITVGDGTDESVRMGPVCGAKQYDTIMKYIAAGKQGGARVIVGGSALTEGKLLRGWFIAPTVFADAARDAKIAQEEIFGPVLTVFRANDLDDAIQLANDTPYGLASAVFTRDLAKAHRFVSESQVGLCHVNLHTAYKEPQLEFGGIKESGRGDPEAGDSGIAFFTEHKSVYVQNNP